MMQSLQAYFKQQHNRDIHTIGRYIQEYVNQNWESIFEANKAEMIRWGLIVLGLLIIGSIPLFVGLAFVLPWLGYSTWHLYTRLIDRNPPARKPRR